MGYRPIFTQNETLAPKIANKVLRLISGLFLLVGKPLFTLLLIALSLFLHLVSITGYLFNKIYKLLLKIYSVKNILGIRKKSGLIFSASRERYKKSIINIQNKADTLREIGDAKIKKHSQQIKNFIWKMEVFPIALGKLLQKSAAYVRLKFQPIKTLRVILLKYSLFLLTLKNNLPRPKLPKFSFLRILSILFIMIFFTGFAGGVTFWHLVLKDLPSPQELTSREQKISTKIYDRNGTLLYNIYKDQNRTPVSLEDIPIQVKLATIAIEDAEFYSHPGFSIKGIARALIKNYKEKKLTGGSTITQQLVKNTLLSSEKTYIRKLKEIVLSVQVELNFNKDKILEMYLNEVSYGGTAYGIQEASRTYFGKDVKNLSLAEASLLAGLPKSPTEFSPFGSNPDLSLSRQKEVLNLMEINGFITTDQKKSAESEKIKFAEQRTDIKAPHFVMYVRQVLEDKYGKNVIDSGGLDITTSLDLQIQNLAEKVVGEELEKLAKLNVTNAAVVVLSPQTGEILAMVGSKNYFDTENDGNVNVTTRPRQPGSSVKIINYAYALSNGMNATTIIPDTPVTFIIDGQPPYTPRNYEGDYRGNLPLRSVLAESRNIPAVRVLASYGVENMINLGRKMGITTWHDPENYGLSLTLGGGEVRLLDLAQAYATISNYGIRPQITPVLKITDLQGNILDETECKIEGFNQAETRSQEEDLIGSINSTGLVNFVSASETAIKTKDTITTKCQGEQVLDPRVAYLITDILRDNVARSPTFGFNSLLIIPDHSEVAVKTGTSNNLRDNLTIGYNQNYLVAVWVGNNDNSPMARIASGITGATPIWNRIITALLASEENHEWVVPQKLVKISICPLTETLACQGCPNKTEWFLEENIPDKACNPDWFLTKEDVKEGSEPSDYGLDEKERNFSPEIIDVGKNYSYRRG